MRTRLVERARDGDDVAFTELVDLDGDRATPSPIGSCAMRSGPRTPSSRHSSSHGASSRGCAIRSASAHGSIGCS